MLGRLKDVSGPLQQSRAVVEVPDFQQQTMMIAPPIVYQTRASKDSCRSALTSAIAKVLDSQIEGKCGNRYACEIPEERVPCYSRGSDSTNQATDPFFGHKPSPRGEDMVYAEFASVLTQASVLRCVGLCGRGEEPSSLERWIDRQTDRVVLDTIFSTPDKAVTTFLTITFMRSDEDGSGRLQGSVDLKSYNTVSEERMWLYVVNIWMNIALNIFDVTFLFIGVSKRMKKRQLLLANDWDTSQQNAIRETHPILKKMEFLDIVLRVFMSWNLVQFFLDKSYMPGQLSFLDEKTNRILSIDWNLRSQSTAEKFEALFIQTASIQEPLEG
jgi:hypothetical protein